MSKKKSPKKPSSTKDVPPKKVRELTETELEEISGGMHALSVADMAADAKFVKTIGLADATNVQLPGMPSTKKVGG